MAIVALREDADIVAVSLGGASLFGPEHDASTPVLSWENRPDALSVGAFDGGKTEFLDRFGALAPYGSAESLSVGVIGEANSRGGSPTI